MKIVKNAKISCGNYILHIGTYDSTEIAIESRATGEIALFKDMKRGKKLKAVKRKFSRYLCSSDAFFFARMHEAEVLELIKLLKK